MLPSYSSLSRRPWFLAPPRRINGSLEGDVLTLHTTQSRPAYKALQRDGVLVGDANAGSWAQDAEFGDAYAWMRSQMERRLGNRAGLLWLWARTSRRAMIEEAQRTRGDVLLTTRVPRHRVLLSDFDAWHSVLNRSFHLPLGVGESYNEFERRYDLESASWDSRTESLRAVPLHAWPQDLRHELERSWEGIFEVQGSRWVQATCASLEAKDVVRAVRIA